MIGIDLLYISILRFEKFDVVKRRRILMRRRPSIDVVLTSIRRQLNVNTMQTLKQRQFNTNDVSVDMTPTQRRYYVSRCKHALH